MRHTAGQDSHRGLGIGLGCDLSAADALVNCLMGRAGEVVDGSIYSWDLVVEWVDSQTIRITNGLLWCNDPSKHRANHSPDGVDFASFSDLFTNLPWVGRGVCNGICQQTAQACGRLWKLLETLNVSKHGPYEAWNKAVSCWDMWQNDIRPFSRRFYSPTVNKFKTFFDDGSH